MMPLLNAQFTAVICWLFAIYFTFDELFHLLRTLYLLAHCKFHGKSETLNSHEFSWFLILTCAVLFLDISKIGHLPLIPAAVCMGGWLFIPLCVILQKKLVSMKSWREYLEDVMERFFNFFEDIRSSLLHLESFARRYEAKALLIILLIYSFWTPVCILSTSGNGLWGMLALPILLFFLLYAACTALHSCKKLLFFWFVHGLLLTLCILYLIPVQGIRNFSAAAEYALFTLVFAMLWIIMAGAADDDVAKMAASIVNTGTTILIILINVLIGWGLNRFGNQAFFRGILEELQYYGNLILLPLIVSGYLTALLKEMQIYRRVRREKREQQNQDGAQLHRR